MIVVACALPASTVLEREFVDGAFFTDSYRIPLKNGESSVTDIFFSIFGHHPLWLKAILLVRHRVGAWFGLNAATTAEVMNPTRNATYRIGQKIGPWPLWFLGEDELVAGRNDQHLDFRVSILKLRVGQSAYAVVSTVCRPHNRFGRVYLLLISPFHKWGVRRLMSKAAQAGRL